jgi:hypothetical protein
MFIPVIFGQVIMTGTGIMALEVGDDAQNSSPGSVDKAQPEWILEEEFASMVQLIGDDEAKVDDVPAAAVDSSNDSMMSIQDWEERLKSNPHYFLGWHGSNRKPLEKWNRADLERALRDMMSYSVRPRSKLEIKECVLSKSSLLTDLILFYLEAFFAITLKDKEWSRRATWCVRGGRAFFARLLADGVSEEYAGGVEYISRWVTLHIILAKGKLPTRIDPDDVNYGTEGFEALPNRSKALILALKAHYVSSLKKFDSSLPNDSVETMRKVMCMNYSIIITDSYTEG